MIATDAFFTHQRRTAIARHPIQIGMDYIQMQRLEVNLWELQVHFIPAASGVEKSAIPLSLTPTQIRIVGSTGAVTSDLQLIDIRSAGGNVVTIAVLHDRPPLAGSAPTYRLELVYVPHLDRFFSQVEFSLQEAAAETFDPLLAEAIASTIAAPPEIDYLAKDYSSFRQLMLDRLATVMPQWTERNPADLGVALVELLAYAADYLSYYQDAVATEAYLHTARRRISMRRHARLLDYRLHEGCNARVWMQFEVSDRVAIAPATRLLTQLAGQEIVIPPDAIAAAQALSQNPMIFATLHGADLFPAHNQMPFYTWGASDFDLPQGATRATLLGKFSDLHPGDVLILEAVRDRELHLPVNRELRHAVRLISVTTAQDAIGGEFRDPPSFEPVEVTEIEWHAQDALPFALPIAAQSFDRAAVNLSVARGNVVLADQGDRHTEILPTVTDGRYRPRLQRPGLTYCVPYDRDRAKTQAATAIVQDPRAAVPSLTVRSLTGEVWVVQPDLLSSDRFAADCLVETESDGSAYLRFGDDRFGKQPDRDAVLAVTYRIGNGVAGNVGQDAIAHLLPDTDRYVELNGKILTVRNPLAAIGGIEPEAIEQVQRDAPQAFRTLKRCVTEADYATVLQQHPDIQQAAAELRWTGSWYTLFIAVDRAGGRAIDPAFRQELLAFLEPFRLMGYDLEIGSPQFVAIDLALRVQVQTGFRSTVKQAILQALGSGTQPNNQRGFFHPDRLTFGQPVYLSQIVQQAMQVPGVAWVEPLRFRTWGQSTDFLDSGKLPIAPLEIARLDNDPGTPQNGRLELVMQGGL